MSDYAPPPGPPPPQAPQVPPGWKAQWNDQYKQYFYVNLHTKQSQWDLPTAPATGPGDDLPPPGAPPSYDHGSTPSMGHEKSGLHDQKTGLSSNNPYAPGGSGPAGASSHQNISEDERLARELQAEEDARMHGGAPGGDRGASDSYYGQGGPGGAGQYPSQPGYGQQSPPPGQYGQQLPPRPEENSKGKSKGGFLGKLLGKAGGSSSRPHGQQQYGGYPQQQGQHFGGGYPPQGQYGGYPQQGYGGYPQQQQMAGRRPGGGMGAAGGLALGAGAGLLGGALIGDAIADDGGGDDGDYGGGDDGGGGDFGGDGGGDFGGDF
ncbi:hypothetical protein K402DRAFT_444066 [Aulographum hederae CBS 113979]|uniref:WW domain-containing protein n=1 Tax=Aulographum hederae CBS 113979 TaxID=1176131 RepID=A0A6G1HCI8_9PEZI|nr:hypothetical protein K402DRAFT_444066 [Aulographum hederae CBS 113979]